jgi:hypothetical protein
MNGASGMPITDFTLVGELANFTTNGSGIDS